MVTGIMRVEHRRHGDQAGVSENLTPRPRDWWCCTVWLGWLGRHPHCRSHFLSLPMLLFYPQCSPAHGCTASVKNLPPRVAIKVLVCSYLMGVMQGPPKSPAIRICSLHIFNFLSHFPAHIGLFIWQHSYQVSNIFPLTIFKIVLWDDPGQCQPGTKVIWLGMQRAPACNQAAFAGPLTCRQPHLLNFYYSYYYNCPSL